MIFLQQNWIIVVLFQLYFNMFHVSCDPNFRYHNNDELENYLRNFVNRSRIYSRLYTIGKSFSGRELWVVEVSATKERNIGVPNIKLIANIHGNEAAGREILLHFLEYLDTAFEASDPRILHLLTHTRVHVLPTLNPDGYAVASKGGEGLCRGENGRLNSGGRRGYDLNRNFPDYYIHNSEPPQPETVAVMEWMEKVPFVLSASLHAGALVANYPFDTVREKTSYEFYPPSIAPDNDVLYYLAYIYAKNHATMHLGRSCPEDDGFKNGVTNGAAWYPFFGGMQDYNYAFKGCMEITLEISCCKFPEAKELKHLWEQNKNALIEYCLQVHQGVAGQILDSYTKHPVSFANLKISGRNMNFQSSDSGEFWRILLPGTYVLEVKAPGYFSQNTTFTVNQQNSSLLSPTFLTVFLINSSISTTMSPTPSTFQTSKTSPYDVSSSNKRNNSTIEETYIPSSMLSNRFLDTSSQVILPSTSSLASFMTNKYFYIFLCFNFFMYF